MGATDKLRAMLEERGEEYEAPNEGFTVVRTDDAVCKFYERFGEPERGVFATVTTDWLTPEQAIAATLGRGTSKAVSMRERDGRPYLKDELVCAKCGCQLAHEFGHVWQNFCPNCGAELIK